MNRITLFLIAGILLFRVNHGYAQSSYSIKVETGFLGFQKNTIDVDPGPNWQGYSLYKQNGLDFNIVNGLDIKNKLFTGIGIGYLNFEGTNGLSAYTDVEYLPFKSKLTPLINLKIGYSHLWNQYENGTGTGLGEFGVGLNYRLAEKMDVYTKSGFSVTQQSLLIPIRLGIRIR